MFTKFSSFATGTLLHINSSTFTSGHWCVPSSGTLLHINSSTFTTGRWCVPSSPLLLLVHCYISTPPLLLLDVDVYQVLHFCYWYIVTYQLLHFYYWTLMFTKFSTFATGTLLQINSSTFTTGTSLFTNFSNFATLLLQFLILQQQNYHKKETLYLLDTFIFPFSLNKIYP